MGSLSLGYHCSTARFEAGELILDILVATMHLVFPLSGHAVELGQPEKWFYQRL